MHSVFWVIVGLEGHVKSYDCKTSYNLLFFFRSSIKLQYEIQSNPYVTHYFKNIFVAAVVDVIFILATSFNYFLLSLKWKFGFVSQMENKSKKKNYDRILLYSSVATRFFLFSSLSWKPQHVHIFIVTIFSGFDSISLSWL